MGKNDNELQKLNNDIFEIKVSVRQLVEFVLRSGDIDNRRTASVDSAMQEGSRLHRLIQSRMGDNYYPEVLLKYQYNTPRYAIIIEGRADGIIIENKVNNVSNNNDIALNQHLTKEEFDEITIDEIKCVAKNLEYITAPVPVHLAQAKVYAFIYCKQKKLPMIRVRMTYCNMETEEIKHFHEEYSDVELYDWFENLIKQYEKWADFQYDWRILRTETIKAVDFPYEYRDGQKELAVYVYQSINRKKKLFIEAPTGVGKTLSTVFPSVKSMGEGLTEKIFYLTAKTITRTVAEDTFDILRRNGLRFKTVTITAKDKICLLDKAECNPAKCERAKGHYDRVNDAMYAAITGYDKIDRSVIEKVSQEYNVCPFELSLDISLFVDGVICDYNYVFDPHASLKRFFSEGMKGDYAFLIDEAHNLVERGREMYSALLYKENFLLLKRDLKLVIDEQPIKKQLKKPSLAARLVKALERCNKELLRLKKESDGCTILDSPDPFVGLVESLRTVMDQFLEEEDDSPIRQEVLEFFFEINHFLLIYEKMDENYTVYCELLPDERFMMKLFCVNPRNNLKEAMAKGRSSILFSATLLPIQYYKWLLGGEDDDYEAYAKSTFDNSKRGLFIANDVTSKYTRRNDLEYHRIASYIFEIISSKKGNYMVFLPSYSFLANVYDHFIKSFYDEHDMELIVQQEFMNEEMREEFLGYFNTENKMTVFGNNKSLVGFCVLGGIFSEGIDLKADSLIGCIIVGTGLPLVCNEREILKDHFDDENSDGFDYAYRYPGMNKVLQAAGRVIRTQEDIGVVALLDERFNSNAYRCLFPREWSNCQIVNNLNIADRLDEFWSGWS